ncbi:hypothetical protein L486_03035 [Kwoniella mangroviensis CBS 10435]|uniref:Uncharacterized protein n=1 Tax=Kwoniella mangroviensis CBS 10435 TaxID=1331196 RepID=A0A1B9IXV0_9TREE|nr:uncharacterized protein I203_01129 [Kwoniella mangroviensis CBS 8507]OCF60353.1 hypothetical protein L486_03035 [Kwoniella mangroviensis CBS 10435]OCF69274.1 hypothetical protein I203_01129 [Kwoniella mangroviensis CBS 8507]OCF72518.1 hypothetical protein I204_06899 [Kwoniella mangroviensis CBS 8886]
MPYLPPNSDQVQPIAIPISKTHQLIIDNIPESDSSDPRTSEDIHTPKPDNHPDAITIPTKESSVDSITSGMTSTSLYSNIPTPPLDHEQDKLVDASNNTSSPAASSIFSLPEQEQDQGNINVKTSRSDSSLRRRQNEINEVMEEEEEEGKKVKGEDVVQSDTDTNSNTNSKTDLSSMVDREEDRNAFAVYRQGLYAYTHTLWIQAKLSSSRAERRRQSVSSQSQFGSKQSGMEKMAAKKALAKRLNG